MSAEEQILRYAADLARIYAEAEQTRGRLRGLEEFLIEATEEGLALVRSLSLEEAARSWASLAGVLGYAPGALYVTRPSRLLKVSEGPGPVNVSAPADLGELGREPTLREGTWGDLLDQEQAVVVPLLGRRRLVAVAVAPGALPELNPSQRALAGLLTHHAGVVIENFLIDERRETTSVPKASGSTTRLRSERLLGDSSAMQKVLALAARVAGVDSSVLLTGETGTGKSLLARAIHQQSPRAKKPLVTLNCGAIPSELVESELFGHEAGAFTGALRQHKGKVEQAAGGTLFLDEIGELPLAVQTKLLTFLEDKRYSRVGGERELRADVRVISATNADLAAAVEARTFRTDLLYRLNVFELELPPLRARGDDVVTVAEAFAREVSRRYDLLEPELDEACAQRLRAYSWPGNLRQLRNVIEKAVILSDGPQLDPELLPEPDLERAPSETSPSVEAPMPHDEVDPEDALSFTEAKALVIERWERRYLDALLAGTGGNVAQAARVAGIDKKNLYRKLKRYEIDPAQVRAAHSEK